MSGSRVTFSGRTVMTAPIRPKLSAATTVALVGVAELGMLACRITK
jgi:hypothetical protein